MTVILSLIVSAVIVVAVYLESLCLDIKFVIIEGGYKIQRVRFGCIKYTIAVFEDKGEALAFVQAISEKHLNGE